MGALVIDETTLAQINGEYPLPPDAGPAWRAAWEAGVDMSLIEGALKLTPEERLAEHQQVIDFLLEVQAAGESHTLRPARAVESSRIIGPVVIQERENVHRTSNVWPAHGHEAALILSDLAHWLKLPGADTGDAGRPTLGLSMTFPRSGDSGWLRLMLPVPA